MWFKNKKDMKTPYQKIDEIRQEMILLFSTVCEKNKDKMTLAMCEGCQKQLESYMRMIELKFHQALSSQAREIEEKIEKLKMNERNMTRLSETTAETVGEVELWNAGLEKVKSLLSEYITNK